MSTDTSPPHDDDSHPISSLLNDCPRDAPFLLYEILFRVPFQKSCAPFNTQATSYGHKHFLRRPIRRTNDIINKVDSKMSI